MIEANKFLGQCFLENELILKYIANVTKIENRDVVEIGPGIGNLTEFIIKNHPKSLKLYEIDIRLIPILQIKFKNIDIIHENCLNVNIDTDVIISNLPYNISTPFCKKLILDYKWNECVLLLQKEFAEKITEIHNILGLIFNLTHDIKIIKYVSNKNFKPKPKVMSSVVYIKKKSHNYDIQKLWKFADQLFSLARKKIGKKFALFQDLRPSQLTLDNIIELYQNYNI